MSLWEEKVREHVHAGQLREQHSFPFILPLSLDSDKILMWGEQWLSLKTALKQKEKKIYNFLFLSKAGSRAPGQRLCRDEVLFGEDEASMLLLLGWPSPCTVISPCPAFFSLVLRDALLFPQVFSFLEIWLVLEANQNYV